MENLTENQKSNVVVGKIVDRLKNPMPGLLVRAFDRDMRSEELLGECVTNKAGSYEIIWLHSQLSGRGVKEADIAIKVLTKEKKTIVFESGIDDVRFNASPREEINIIIKDVIEPEILEYDYLHKEISFLADKVSIVDLQQNEKNQDITFLSRELNMDSEKIEFFVVANRVEDVTKINAAFFYALLRKNTLSKNNLSQLLSVRTSVDINSNIQTLVYDAALADPRAMAADIASAVHELIVSPDVLERADENIRLLERYRKLAEEYYKTEHPRKVIETVSRFMSKDKMDEVKKLFDDNKNDLGSFFSKIMDPSFFGADDPNKKNETGDVLGQLLGIGEEVIPQIMNSRKIESAADIKKLATLNKDEWMKELGDAKKNSKNAASDNKILSIFASSIVRKMEKLYPTAAFTAQLKREKKTVMPNQKKLVAFLEKYDDFDLTKHNIELFLKENKITDKDSQDIKEELKSIQRVFKLVPHYGKTNALRDSNIDSSQKIVATGKSRFLNEVAPTAGIDTTEAKMIFEKAETVNTATMLVAGELQDTMRGMDVASLETGAMEDTIKAVTKDFPNLKSLFKLADTCTCEHCRSVYSPAAYMVEVLQFLKNRSVVDLTIPAPIPPQQRPSINGVAQDILFKRRPEIGEIDLGCENAEVPVKYIDLVCEILEDAVSPEPSIIFNGEILTNPANPTGTISNALLTTLNPQYPVTAKAQVYAAELKPGFSSTLAYVRDYKIVFRADNLGPQQWSLKRLRQTFLSAPELAAAPEYKNENAYALLKTKAFAFGLPFDLDHVEAKAYFNRFNISRAELMKNFQLAGNPTNDSIASETLGLTDSERIIISSPKMSELDQQAVWNPPTPVVGSVVDYMKTVSTFLNKSELQSEELKLVFKLDFINQTNLFIDLDFQCNTDIQQVQNLDLPTLDRLHRFLRLQKKTGWKFETLDAIISQPKLGNKILDDACLVKAATLLTISRKTGIAIDELIGFYGDIPNKILLNDIPKPLYQQVFLNKAKNGFEDSDLQPANVNGGQLLSAKSASIAVCLQIKLQDLEKLLPLLPVNALTFANLSLLLAAARILKKLKISVDDMLILRQLTANNFWDSPQRTLDFVNAAVDSRKSPLKLADVKFLIRHEAADIPDLDPRIKSFLEKLQKDYQNNFAVNKSLYDPNLTSGEQLETLKNELSKLPGITPDSVQTFVKFIDRNWASLVAATSFVDSQIKDLLEGIMLGGLTATNFINSKIAELDAMPVPTKEQNIKDYNDAQTALRVANDSLSAAKTLVEKNNANAAIAAATATLAAVTPKYNIASGKNLLQAFLAAAAAFQLETGKQAILLQSLSIAFKADQALIDAVINNAQLKQPAAGDFLSLILRSDVLIDTNPDPGHVPVLTAISSATFSTQYGALKLLSKLLPLVNPFKITVDQLPWFFKYNGKMNWLEFDSIPYDAGQLTVGYDKYIAFALLMDIIRPLTPVINPADAENSITVLNTLDLVLLTPQTAVIRTQFLSQLALLTGYDNTDLVAVDAYLFPGAVKLDDYKDEMNWRTIINCLENLRSLGSIVAQVTDYIKPTLLPADVTALRIALKSRYDENTWLSTLKEIMDAIRPQKRDALTAYLLATNHDVKDVNDLYEYFLMDLKVESCMPSSRIVFAHGTLQLFVRRCLMAAEPAAAADVDNDNGWNQWKWMENYRVWEANRKIFLYPENWIEPDLRDEKSFLFSELQNEIQQNALTDFTTEDAVSKYLYKLDNIAFLEVVATWYQPDTTTMYIFARSKGGDPAMYYYRKLVKERYFTAWEKVDLDITSEFLMAFIHNNRLDIGNSWPPSGKGSAIPCRMPSATDCSPGCKPSPGSSPSSRMVNLSPL